MNSRVFYVYGLLLFVFLIPNNGFAVIPKNRFPVIPETGLAKIRHVCFIVNPTSNNGQGARVWESIEQAVNHYFAAVGSQDEAAVQERATFEVFFTEHAGHATELATQAYQSWQQGQREGSRIPDQLLMVAVGGDGTVHEVVQGLEAHREQVVFGVIPAGTGNNIARSLRLRDTARALRTLVYGTALPLGAYKIEACERGSCQKKTVLAVNEFDLGVTTQVKKRENDYQSGERAGRLMSFSPGSRVYSLSDFTSAMRWNTPMVKCSIDGGSRFHIPLNIMAGGATGPTIGGEFGFLYGERAESKRGELLYGEKWDPPLWTLAQVAMQRLLNWSGLKRAQFTQLDIEHVKETPQDIQVDGDILLQTPARIIWLPEVFRFLRPPVFGDHGYHGMYLEEAEDERAKERQDSI
ncbi:MULTISPECIES: diacylglycerol kinase family protein [unclassified Endozoicomonas]|uniref:diacylglycerol/lipid kinase family protein n=1 Tax=unclassified Endozoicomonas TaxID=2644528 RepID=UPI002147871C